jgi:hypothetical protein
MLQHSIQGVTAQLDRIQAAVPCNSAHIPAILFFIAHQQGGEWTFTNSVMYIMLNCSFLYIMGLVGMVYCIIGKYHCDKVILFVMM